MNRRKFLTSSALLLGSIPVTSELLSSTKDSCKLEIITDNPDEALKLADNFFKQQKYNGIIKFKEYEFIGEAFGDIVLIEDGELIDFKSRDQYSDLIEISSHLRLPKKVINPVRLSFSTEAFSGKASKFLIIRNGLVIDEIKASENFIKRIGNDSSENICEFKNGYARMITSSCTHKNCIKSGAIKNHGEEIICIPNRLRIVAA